MHISDKIENELFKAGWDKSSKSEFKKFISGFDVSGSLSNGDRLVCLEISENGRWLSRVDGWGHVMKDVDLREFDCPKEAISSVLLT